MSHTLNTTGTVRSKSADIASQAGRGIAEDIAGTRQDKEKWEGQGTVQRQSLAEYVAYREQENGSRCHTNNKETDGRSRGWQNQLADQRSLPRTFRENWTAKNHIPGHGITRDPSWHITDTLLSLSYLSFQLRCHDKFSLAGSRAVYSNPVGGLVC